MGNNIGKNLSKNLSGKSAKNHAEQSATYAFKRANLKTAEATGDLLVIKLLIKLRGFQKIHNRIF